MSVAMPTMDTPVVDQAVPEPPRTDAFGAPRQLTAGGRLRDPGVTETERQFSIAMHLTPFAAMVFGPALFTPLVLWLIRRDKSSFNDDHGREVVNFGISYLLLTLLFSWTVIVPIILFFVAIVNLVRGAVAASNGEFFRYPMTIRFLS
ncbi:MAG: DUF4870 domain-containing protein [Planctomycetota bacterium]|jgi:uncharacterized Tic20 family protein